MSLALVIIINLDIIIHTRSHTYMYNSYTKSSHNAHIQQSPAGVPCITVDVPNHILARWCKHVGNVQNTRHYYDMAEPLRKAHVSTEEFRKCWQYVSDKIPAQELFRMLKDAGIGQRDSDISDKVNFVKIVLKHYRVFLQISVSSLSLLAQMHSLLIG